MRSTTARSHWRAIFGVIEENSPTHWPAITASVGGSPRVTAAPRPVGISIPRVARKLAPPPPARRVGRLGAAGTRSFLGGIGRFAPSSAVQVDDHVVEREPQRARVA